MASGFALALLALSLAVTLGAARMFAQRLDRLGAAFGLPEALVGLLTALAADGPEISSALIALAKGQHGAGVGVVVGSNAFNLAAMVGLSALLSGAVTLRRAALALEGAMALAATLLAGAVLLGWLNPVVGVILLACLGGPYLFVLVRGRDDDSQPHTGLALQREAAPTHPRHALWIVSDVALIVAGSFGMVQGALALGGHWGISDTLVGVLVLAPLTSLPNAFTGVRLGRAGRGAALVSETLNSNTINLAGGVMVPALFVTVTSASTSGHFDLAWLLGMTCLCLLCLARPRGAGRAAGGLLVLLYAGFVALQLT
jgi:cation:H+ antiporter